MLWFAEPFNVIDAQMAFQPSTVGYSDARWIMVYKDEDDPDRGGKNLRFSTAPADLSQPWTPPSPPLVGPGSSIRPGEQTEGPCLIRWKDQWFLYWDAFTNGHYGAATSRDLLQWQDRTDELKTPPNPRHGTVFSIPSSVLDMVQNAITNAENVTGSDPANAVKIYFNVNNSLVSGSLLTDTTGAIQATIKNIGTSLSNDTGLVIVEDTGPEIQEYHYQMPR